MEAQLGLGQDPPNLAAEQFDSYVEAIGAAVVPAEGAVSLDDLLARYFGLAPPFSSKDAKKHEFPDAIALMSLERWAEGRDALVMAVSADKGWQEYAAGSERLFCVDNINQALDYFNVEAHAIAARVLAMMREHRPAELEEAIERAFEYALDDPDFDVGGYSPFDFDYQEVEAVIQSWQFSEEATPLVIASDDDSVTFSVEVDGLVSYSAEFYFYVEDSIDRDNVSLGSEVLSAQDRATFTIVVTVGRDLEPELGVIEVEVPRKRLHVDYGDIDPGWGYEE